MRVQCALGGIAMAARRGIAFALVLATACAAGARTAIAEPGPSGARPLGAQVGIEWAVGTRDGESQKLELRIEPELDLALPGNFRLKGIGRLRADAFDELEPGPPDQPEVAPYTRRLGFGDRIDAELRELFVQGRVGPAWLRIGKQQIVWGQADGLKLLDVVNPQNFDEFILPVFEDSRIPLWTLDVEVPIDDAQLQLFWIPDPTTHDIPPLDGVFAFTAPRLVGEWPPPGVALRIEDVDRPDDPLRDSDVGARLSGFWKGWDLTANALWHYDDILIPFRTIDLSSGAPQVRVAPGFRRTPVLGGSASNAFGNLTVRGEMAAHLDRWFPTDDVADRDGVVRTTDVGWVLGLDWYGFPDTLLSAQLFQSFLTDHRPGVIRDRLDNSVTVLARRTFRHETLTLETIWIQSINDGDGLVRPRVEYAVRDDLQVWMGFDVFYGTRDGIYGEFDENDRFVIGFEWGL
jgi:hypothetical protein